VAYFAHDVNHADISRRLDMLALGGADVRLLGFHRGTAASLPCVDLGRTWDAKLLQRAVAVLKALVTLPRWAKELNGADVIVARNLEMLALAVVARGLGAREARLVYECLDIHRLMSGKGAASLALRALERFLIARVDGLMVSSPGFLREHFAKLGSTPTSSILVENKVGVNDEIPPRESAVPSPGPPWRIGWFGIIRCRRSLDVLIEAATRNPGLMEIVIAGRVAKDVVGDIAAEIPAGIGVSYLGPFADEAQLAQFYRSAHFAWLADFYEAGANSDWLLPNRLYRSAYYGAVPIALSHVETGRWLEGYGAGLRLDAISAGSLAEALARLSEADYLAEKARLEAIPTAALVAGRDDCVELVARLAGSRAAARGDEPDALDRLKPSFASGVRGPLGAARHSQM
jgi:glycosyltransferase involved in cell wall biosynthesis